MKTNSILLILLLIAAASAVAQTKTAPVMLADDGKYFTLANGIVTVKIEKDTAAMASFRYRDWEILGGMGRDGYWTLPAVGLDFGRRRTAAVRLDPATNNGERAIVSCRFEFDGDPKTVPSDVEMRYALGRGDSGVYLEEIWHHKPEHPRLTFPVGRFVVKLNDEIFDWMTVDKYRSMQMITADDWNRGTVMNMKEARLMTQGVMKGQVEHKYDYAAVQFETPAYGWSSTKDKIGIWLINPSFEYMSGGPTKLELSAHRDATFTDSLTAPAPPTILNVWKGPHYGGTVLEVEKGEEWRKTIGPFMLYANSAPSTQAMYSGALKKAAAEAGSWVYPWAVDEHYPGARDRGAATGRIVLNDIPGAKMSNLLVGLAHPDYKASNGTTVDWQKDGKYYQFWVRAGADGTFTIRNVRPGKYTLHAFADGVLGEFARTGVTIEAGKSLKLGKLVWNPVRYGRQVWEIGIPDRTALEYNGGSRFMRWGLYNDYPKTFPNDVNYVIGKSHFAADWNVMQVPRAKDDTGKGRGDETVWRVSFELQSAPKGKATLRISFAGAESRTLGLRMNDQQIGTIDDLPDTAVIRRNSVRGYWFERAVEFDASTMKAGTNVLQLIVPAGNVMRGVEYDYLRLELDENAN